MKPITLALAALLLSSAAAATAQTGSTSSASASAPQPIVRTDGRGTGQATTSADPQERRVCRRLDTTGSRNARPTCMTVRQWRQYDRP